MMKKDYFVVDDVDDFYVEEVLVEDFLLMEEDLIQLLLVDEKDLSRLIDVVVAVVAAELVVWVMAQQQFLVSQRQHCRTSQ